MPTKPNKPHKGQGRCSVASLPVGSAALRQLTSLFLMFLVTAGPARVSSGASQTNRWIEELRSKNAGVRVRAAYSFHKLQPVTKTTVLSLVEGLKDYDPYVRRYSASALGEIDIEPDIVVPALVASLRDPDRDVREHTAVALVKIGSPAVPHLIEVVKNTDVVKTASEVIAKTDGDQFEQSMTEEVIPLRDYAAFALIEIGTPAISLLVEVSTSDDDDLRHYADYILKEIADSAETPLAIFLDDPDHRVRLWAATGLLNFRNWEVMLTSARSRPADSDAPNAKVLVVLTQILSGADRRLHAKAAKTLGLMGAGAASSVPVLRELLKSGDGKARAEAVESLGKIGGNARAAIPELLALLADPSPRLRERVINALSRISDRRPAVVDALLKALNDADTDVQIAAASALVSLGTDAKQTIPALVRIIKGKSVAGDVGDGLLYRIPWRDKLFGPAIVPALLELLGDENEHVRLDAIKLLEWRAKPDARFKAALMSLLNDPSKNVRIKAATLLCTLSAAAVALPVLTGLLKDTDQKIRREAAGVLGFGQCGASALPALLEAVKDAEPEVRQAALRSLGSVPSHNTVTRRAFINALSDSDLNVKLAAAMALEEIPGPDREDIADEAIPLLVRAIETESRSKRTYYSSNWYFLSVLSKFGPRAAPAFLELLKSEDENVLSHALSWLTRPCNSRTALETEYSSDNTKTPAACDKRVTSDAVTLLGDIRPWARLAAVKALRRFRSLSPRALSALVKLLADPDANVRAEVLFLFGDRGRRGVSAVTQIKKLLEDPEGKVRLAAIIALLKINSDKQGVARALARELRVSYERPLSSELLWGKEVDEDDSALIAITKLGETAVPVLRDLLKDKSVEARRNASAALSSHAEHARTAIPELLLALNDSDPEVRRHAARAVEKIGSEAKDAGQSLVTLLYDPDEEIRQIALDALVAIGFDLSKVGPALQTAANDGFIRDTLKNSLKEIKRGVRPTRSYAAPARLSLLLRTTYKDPFPRLPWPPPRFSDRYVLPRSALGTDKNTLANVNERLTSALRNSGYDTTGVFIVPGGYAIATRVERIRENDGSPYPLPHRWTRGKVSPTSVRDYLGSLFLEKPGQFRMFVFVITNLNSIGSSAERLTEEDAWSLYRRGGGVLPGNLGRTTFRDVHCHVLIYRFQKRFGQGATIEYADPLGLTSEKHLRGSGLLRTLGL